MSNADGSNPESGRQADADEARAQALDLSAFCCARRDVWEQTSTTPP
jgi:hypothetical protein